MIITIDDIDFTSYESFKNSVLGNSIDLDGHPASQPYQCWDLCATLWRHIGHELYTGGQDAKGCWKVASARAQNTVEGYFTQVTSIDDLKRGDVIVLDGNLFSSTGHVALCDEDGESPRMLLLGQNQGSDRTHVTVAKLGVTNFLGGFRYIPWNQVPPSTKKRRYPWPIALEHWR